MISGRNSCRNFLSLIVIYEKKKMNLFTKLVSALLLLVVIWSCQKEEFTIVEDQEQKSFLGDSLLKGLLQSVASHDGSFDDLIDASSCFSIGFPYEIVKDGRKHLISSINDLTWITEMDVVEPVFPMDISFANYTKTVVMNTADLQELKNGCANGQFFDDRITCVDFIYPLSLAVYNTGDSSFETIILDHDKTTFLTIQNFEENTLASINYPIEIKINDDVILTVSSDEQLKSQILNSIPLCN